MCGSGKVEDRPPALTFVLQLGLQLVPCAVVPCQAVNTSPQLTSTKAVEDCAIRPP